MREPDLEWPEGISDADKLRALEELIYCAFSVSTNMNDTFEFSCADAGKVEADDVPVIAPLLVKYGHHALTAYEAVRRSVEAGECVDPITCRCCHDGEEYKAARAEVEALIELDEEGWPKILTDTMFAAGRLDETLARMRR